MHIFTSAEEFKKNYSHCVATIGKYDGMHLGHQQILDVVKQKAAQAQLPAVVILSEPQPEEFFAANNVSQKAPIRLNHFADKTAFLKEYGIQAVFELEFNQHLSEMQPEQFIEEILISQLGVKVLVIGDDFRFGKNRTGDKALLQEQGALLGYEVHPVGACSNGDERVSSTLVREYLAAGNCGRAHELLGRPFSIAGQVVEGKKLGRQIGVPTANLHLQRPELPLQGVYVVQINIATDRYTGVANIGYKPTVSQGLQPSLEVHIFDFDQDIYGQHISVGFLQKIRVEKKFASLEQLKAQISQDIKEAKAWLINRPLNQSGTAQMHSHE